ncbi:MAG TPA: hypothetical protein VKV20_00120 [Ktedonobacteraceae bacterium]|jgi:hypothetical protein|nr:hypothetical protein [Ktedonobacteraceae bacterium]
MALLLTAPQCFFIAMLAFGVLGFMRGWRREIVSMAFSLAGVLFLYLGGGKGLADFIFVRFPIILQIIAGGNSSSTKTPPTPTDVNVLVVTIIAFVVIVGLGYIIGNRAFPKPATPAERFLGVIPAVITGYALIEYVTNVFAKSPLITVGVNTPSQSQVGNYLLIIFVVAVVAVIAGLIAANAKKGGSGKK